MNQNNEYYSIEESRVKSNERIFWSGFASGKSLALNILCHTILWLFFTTIIDIVAYFFIPNFALALLLMLLLSSNTLIFLLVFIPISCKHQIHGIVMITENKLVYSCVDLTFWYTYDEIFSVKKYKKAGDRLGKTASVKMDNIITWTNDRTGQIVARKRGTTRLKYLPEKFYEVLSSVLECWQNIEPYNP